MSTRTRTDGNGPSAPPRRGRRILVAGLGNLLLMDDGVGVHAVRELRRHAGSGVMVAEVGTAVLDALHLIEKADRLLAIDAMRAGGAPGTIYSFGVEDVKQRPTEASLHELNLLSALTLTRRRPREITILGVEPGRIDYGLELTPAVQEALPRLVSAASRIVAKWVGGTFGRDG
ncbi:MAG TPA: hydrogenase maturation protease [Bryobacteraceae bacterium]|nr:hydrogenase maturation protease [Bryobacteraceae bacterium]